MATKFGTKVTELDAYFLTTNVLIYRDSPYRDIVSVCLKRETQSWFDKLTMPCFASETFYPGRFNYTKFIFYLMFSYITYVVQRGSRGFKGVQGFKSSKVVQRV